MTDSINTRIDRIPASPIIMNETCDKLNELLSRIPTYASWTVPVLEKVFIQFAELVRSLLQQDEFNRFAWFEDYLPALSQKVRHMSEENPGAKQCILFNNIVYELQFAAGVLLGEFECHDLKEWEQIISRVNTRY